MKNNNKFLFPIACAFLLSSSVVYGDDDEGGCLGLAISGEIETIWINGAQQAGKIKIDDEVGKDETCGILGTITSFFVEGAPKVLTHSIICDDSSSITTVDYVTSAVQIDSASCESGIALHVEEFSYIIDGTGTGRFSGASGNLWTEGDVCYAGENSLYYTGCLDF